MISISSLRTRTITMCSIIISITISSISIRMFRIEIRIESDSYLKITLTKKIYNKLYPFISKCSSYMFFNRGVILHVREIRSWRG